MNEQEIRAVVARFVNNLRKKGFKQAGNFIVLEERAGQYRFYLSDRKGGLFSIAYPSDLSDKSATATCELSGILYYALKNRQRNLKAAQSVSKEARIENGRRAMRERWGSNDEHKN